MSIFVVMKYHIHFLFSLLFLLFSSLGGSCQVYINEFMASNSSAYLDTATGTFGDWIELYNQDSDSLDISGYMLSDDRDDPAKFIIPDQSIIAGHGYLLVFADKLDARMHASFGLSKSGEEVVLRNTDGLLIDVVIFPEQKTNVSYGRDPDNLQHWLYFGEATPGAANTVEGIGRPTAVASPSLNLPAGFYTGSVVVSLTEANQSDLVVYYTTDGSEPGRDDQLFPREISIDTSTVIRIRAFQTGLIPSEIKTYSYFIDEVPDLPVLSMSIDPVHLYNDEYGIYVDGSGFDGSRESRNSCTQDWERPIHLEYFDENGVNGFSLQAGVQVKGRMNCEFPRKPLGIYFRSKYGEGSISYQLFKEKTVTEFSSFILRPGGADGMGDCYNGTMFRDGLLSTLLIDKMDIDYEGYQPAVFFVNGTYWGIHNIRERNKADYLAGNHNIDPDNIDLLENPANGGIIKGDDLHYNEMIQFLFQAGQISDEELNTLSGMIDINELINYQIAEIFVNNEDWAHNNVLCWRPRTDEGKWRWVFFDVEGGFGLYSDEDYLNNMFDYKGDNYLHHDRLFTKLLSNPGFKANFIQRFAAHLNTTFETNRVLGVIDSLYYTIAREMPRDIERWTGMTTRGGSGCSTISSLAQWNDHVENMREFARKRPDVIRDQLLSQYELDGMVNLNLRADNGRIMINGMENAGGGSYFKNIPIRLTAVPNPGYQFVEWVGLSKNPEIELSLLEETSLVAVFQPDGLSILPNRIDGHVRLKSSESPYVLSGDLIVPEGSSLYVEAGTELMLSGSASIYVYGTVQFDGSQEAPVSLRCIDPNQRWGALCLIQADEQSFINYVEIEQASLATMDPVLLKANVNLIETNLSTTGLKIMDAPKNAVFIHRGRVQIHKPILQTIGVGDYINALHAEHVLISDGYFLGNDAEDTDAIDLDEVAGADIQTCLFQNFFGPNSDGIDVGNSDHVQISNNIFSEISDKAISIGKGSIVSTRGNIFSNCNSGVGVKDLGSTVMIDRSTFYNNAKGIDCFEKEVGRGGGTALVSNTLFAGKRQLPVAQDYYSNLQISYCFSESDPLPGAQNRVGNADLLSPETGNFNLKTNSLCRDAGNPDHERDPDGSRPDIGAKYVFTGTVQDLYINEIQVFDDYLWFELYNAGPTEIAIDDLMIYTDPLLLNGVMLTDILKSSANLAPGEYKTYEIDYQNILGLEPIIRLELIQLHADQKNSVSYLQSYPIEAGYSYGCYPNGSYNYHYFRIPSPGYENVRPESLAGKLFINEILAKNTTGLTDQEGETDDWIELYNAGPGSVNVAGLYLSDDKTVKWKIPGGRQSLTHLEEGDFLILWADGDIEQGFNHLNFRLSGNGEQLHLFQYLYPDTLMIDSLSYAVQEDDISFGRYPDGSSEWRAMSHVTPGSSNVYMTIDEPGYSFTVAIFPNPATDYLNVRITGDPGYQSRLEIIDLNGRILFAQGIREFMSLPRLDVSRYPKGLYFVRINSKSRVVNKRIVIN